MTLTRRSYLIAATLLSAVIFGLAMLLVLPRLAGARADFTGNGLYTVSSGTKAVLEDLSEPVDLTFVYSRTVGQDYPTIAAYAARVRELLDAYAGIAGEEGLIVREIDAEPFSEAEDEALASGVTALDTNGGDPLYFGLIGRNAVDDEIVIPFLSPDREAALEYNLTRLISRLDNPDPVTVGVLTSLPGMSGDGFERGYFILREMSKSYTVREIAQDFVALPEGMDVLIMAQPPFMNERQEWLIDQFLLRGGRIMAFVDPAPKTFGDDASLGRFARQWDVEVSSDAVADVASALPVEVVGEDGRTTVLGQPLFIAAPPARMSQSDMSTADLSRAINFGAPGAVIVSEDSPLNAVRLIETSENPSYIDAALAAGNPDPSDIVVNYDAQNAPLALAVRLSGNLETAFPNGEPPIDLPDDPALAELTLAAAGESLEHLTRSEAPAQIVLIADVDMLDDGFYIDPGGSGAIADNAAFVLNTLDGLAGASQLLSLRARAPALRPMARVDAMRADAEAKFIDEQKRLEARLAANQDRLQELLEIGSSDGFYAGDVEANLSETERAELAKLRGQIMQTRTRLRAIERDYRREIDGLEAQLKAINIWGAPILVALAGLFVWYRRRRA